MVMIGKRVNSIYDLLTFIMEHRVGISRRAAGG